MPLATLGLRAVDRSQELQTCTAQNAANHPGGNGSNATKTTPLRSSARTHRTAGVPKRFRSAGTTSRPLPVTQRGQAERADLAGCIRHPRPIDTGVELDHPHLRAGHRWRELLFRIWRHRPCFD